MSGRTVGERAAAYLPEAMRSPFRAPPPKGAGPIGEGGTSSYHLSWEAAKDNVTPSSKIVYNVYQATTAGGENFSQPTYTTAAGVTSFDTPQLPTGKTFYFVVRARDQAGNEDSNTTERQ